MGSAGGKWSMSFLYESLEDEDRDKKGEQSRSHGSFPRYTNDMPSPPPPLILIGEQSH